MRRYPDIDRAVLERKRDRMDQEFEEAMVAGYEPLIADIVMDDPKDQHVLAAARKCNADVIVTENVRHFPAAMLTPLGIFAQTADDFIADQIGVTPESSYMVAIALVRHKKSLTRSKLNWRKYFCELARKVPHSFAEFNTAHFRQLIANVILAEEWRNIQIRD